MQGRCCKGETLVLLHLAGSLSFRASLYLELIKTRWSIYVPILCVFGDIPFPGEALLPTDVLGKSIQGFSSIVIEV